MQSPLARQDYSAYRVYAASDRQVAYINSLLSGRALPATWRPLDTSTLDSRTASLVIDILRDLPVKAPVAAAPAVAAGRYALIQDGVTKFYRVDRPTEGKWAGYVFVKVQAGDDFWPIKGAGKDAILAAIAADPDALARYGRELGICGVCGRTLTDEESRARGIGPVCLEKGGA